MQKFILALFSVVALLGLVVPSFAHAGRNGGRMARGLSPLRPSRRGTAKRASPSQVHKPQGTTHRIQIRNTEGTSLGYLTDFDNDGKDLLVKYHPGTHSLSFKGAGSSANYIGALLSKSDLGPNSSAFVELIPVAIDNNQADAHLWTLDGDGRLTAIWSNPDGELIPVSLFLNNAGTDIILAGGPAKLSPGWEEVQFYYTD